MHAGSGQRMRKQSCGNGMQDSVDRPWWKFPAHTCEASGLGQSARQGEYLKDKEREKKNNE